MIKQITLDFYRTVCSSLLSEDKVVMSFMLATRVGITDSKIRPEELSALFPIFRELKEAGEMAKPVTWMSDVDWKRTVAVL